MLGSRTIFDEALNSIVENKIKFSTIKAGTGTGKTTTLPCKLCTFPQKFKVCVVLPTREAVYNAYNRASTNQINNVNVNFSVGYAANSVIEYHNSKISNIRNRLYGDSEIINEQDTRLVYCTTGHFENILYDCIKYIQEEDVNIRTLNIFDYVFLDEVHLKSMSIDMILGMLKFLLTSFSNKLPPSVICTSATYSEPMLFEIYGGVIYNTEEMYLPDEAGKVSIETILHEIGPFIRILLENQLAEIEPSVALVFLPGKKEILEVKKILDTMVRVDVVIAHSDRTKEQMKEVFTPNNPGKWKFILSTNIAETSITIPNVKLIIDSMIENIRVVGPNQTTYNKTVFISKDSAAQRKGRTGRTCDGIIVRMITRFEFSNLENIRQPEIKRLPIANELMKVVACNIDTRFIFGDINNGIARSISEDQSKRLNLTIKQLSSLKLIKKCGDYFTVNKSGKFVASLMVNTKTGYLIYNAIKGGIDPYPVIVLGCMVENADIIFNGSPGSFISSIPLATFILPWLKFCSKYGNIKVNTDKVRAFCDEFNLNYDGFRDSQRKIIDCIMKIQNLGIIVDIYMFEPEQIFLSVRGILNEIYYQYKRKDNVYVSTNEKIKHQPLILNNKYTPGNVEYVTSILNISLYGKSNILVWYDSNYIETRISVVDSIIEETVKDEVIEEEEQDEEENENGENDN